jgi:DNA-binding transcriptional LysR family regulator
MGYAQSILAPYAKMTEPCGVDLFQHMATFVRIADSGSISKAARSLRLSVAMTSRHLRALEEHLGVELMRRTTRSLALTEAGTEFLFRSRSLLAGVDEACDVVRPGCGATGLVVLSLPVSFGLAKVSSLFYALIAEHSRLKFDMRFEDRIVDLLGDGIDLAIRAGVSPPDSPFVVARRLAAVRRVVCASPTFLARHARVNAIPALARLPCIVQGEAPTTWHFDAPDGSRPVVVNGRIRTNNILAAREAALAGAGIARLPLWIIYEDLRKKQLVRILEGIELPLVEIFGLFHRGSRRSSTLRIILDSLALELPRRLEIGSGP